MKELIGFLTLLNERIPPGNRLAKRHSVELGRSGDALEVNLFPAVGGRYHVVLSTLDARLEDLVDEVERIYLTCKMIEGASL